MKITQWSFKRYISQLNDDIKKKRGKRWVARGERRLTDGALEDALACCRKSISIYNNLSSAYSLMARALMPGGNHIAALSHFHDFLRPESYVEIGVGAGRSLAVVKPETKAIGIDPNPHDGIESHAKLYKIPSDHFFESYDLLEELGSSRLAVAFIDGLHQYEQVLRDFINVERYADKETIILVHDCLPVSRLVASHTHSTAFWCGDVWKVIPILSKYRPDLMISVVPARPTGLGIITNPDPGSTVLAEEYDRIVAEYRDLELEYDFLDLDKLELLKAKYNIVPNDWEYISRNILHGFKNSPLDASVRRGARPPLRKNLVIE